jgi:hypothetical protein
MAESAKQVQQFNSFTDGLDKDKVVDFEKLVIAWEADHRQPNPYAVVSSSKCFVTYLLRSVPY